MNSWVIPYVDQPLSFWQEIASQFGAHVNEVYFPLPVEIVASGRPPQPSKFMETFLRHASLPKSVLINPIVLLKSAAAIAPQVVETVRRLRDNYGVSGVTVTHLGLARLIKQAIPEIKITASILMGIATPLQAAMLQNDVDAITVDNRLLRDLRGLGQLRRAFTREIRLIVNEACLPGCPYRPQHFYEMAYGDDYPRSLCERLLDEQPWLRLTGAWVLPQHLHHYDGLYDRLKLAGRVTLRDPDRYFRILRAYIHRESLLPHDIGGGPASVLSDIQISDELFTTMLHCAKNCHVCSVCREYYEQALVAKTMNH